MIYQQTVALDKAVTLAQVSFSFGDENRLISQISSRYRVN